MSSQPEFFPVGSQTIYLSASDGDDGPEHSDQEQPREVEPGD